MPLFLDPAAAGEYVKVGEWLKLDDIVRIVVVGSGASRRMDVVVRATPRRPGRTVQYRGEHLDRVRSVLRSRGIPEV